MVDVDAIRMLIEAIRSRMNELSILQKKMLECVETEQFIPDVLKESLINAMDTLENLEHELKLKIKSVNCDVDVNGLSDAQEVLDDATQKAVASNVITGGSDESVAMQKAAAAAAVGKMMQDQAVQGAAKREGVWNNAQKEIDQMNSYIASTELNKGLTAAKNITQAASGVANAANDLDFGTAKIGNKGLKIDF